MQTIYLDISNKGVVPTVYAKQGDVGRKFQVVFTNSGLPYVPPNGSAFSVWYSGQSGEGNYTEIGNNSAFSINGNKVTVEMIAQMLTNSGSGVLCLVLNESNGNQIGSWNIPYLCEKVPGIESEAAKEYYTAFSKSVEGLKQITENLTPEAIGAHPNTWLPTAAEIGAAPAGYGLGESVGMTLTSADNCNNAFRNGWYNVIGAANAASQYNHVMLVLSYGSAAVHQIAFLGNADSAMTYIKIRKCYGSAWNEWEYLNPACSAGVEYRTTERWRGKAVYKKLVDFGSLPANASSGVPVGVSGLNVCRATGSAFTSSGEYTPIPMGSGGAFGAYFWVDPNGQLYVRTMQDLSAYSGAFVLEYVKD